MRKRWEVTRSSSEAIYEHTLHCYTLKSNDNIAESFCCEHIEFEQPMTSTTSSSSIANRNETTSFQMLREWCYNISNCLHTSYQQYGTCNWSIDSMGPLFKKLWKQSKFTLQLFFSKNWNESKFWNGFQKKNYIIWCFQEKRCQEFIFWRMNLKMNLEREKIPLHDINISHDTRSTWVLMCIRRFMTYSIFPNFFGV